MHSRFERSVSALAKAADVAEVPIFVLSRARSGQTSPAYLPEHRVYTTDGSTPLWRCGTFAGDLHAENRSAIVFAGLWLEYELLATALNALVDGYDTYIAIDAAPARSSAGTQVSLARLLQFGATPILSSQAIHEWCHESEDVRKRQALLDLMAMLIAD